jgi:hypothetical protein
MRASGASDRILRTGNIVQDPLIYPAVSLGRRLVTAVFPLRGRTE